jgi:hypothetical protein
LRLLAAALSQINAAFETMRDGGDARRGAAGCPVPQDLCRSEALFPLDEIWSLDDRDFAEKTKLFPNGERSKFETQKGLIFGLVLGR